MCIKCLPYVCVKCPQAKHLMERARGYVKINPLWNTLK
jgi:hypothetical protein